MKILIDRYIPFFDGVFDGLADVEYLSPEAFTRERVHDADALIVRTRTRFDGQLLSGSHVQFIATATIGFDHIDTAWCDTHGIRWTSCPGCNAQAVCDYIEEALNHLGLTAGTLGVVGVGHVGSLVAEMARQRGMTVLENDPPRGIGVSLEQIAEQSDVITFHTPLTREGRYRTYHLCDAALLHRCKPEVIIINAARGGIIDEEALLDSGKSCVIDCWEDEPAIRHALVHSPQTLLASYHIAGYSIQGKRNASRMCLDALCRHFHLPTLMPATGQLPSGDNQPGWLERVTKQLKAAPETFETLRKHYLLRP